MRREGEASVGYGPNRRHPPMDMGFLLVAPRAMIVAPMKLPVRNFPRGAEAVDTGVPMELIALRSTPRKRTFSVLLITWRGRKWRR